MINDKNEKYEYPTLENYKDFKLEKSLVQNLSNIKNLMSGSSDLLINTIEISGHRAALLCCEGLVGTQMSTQLILRPLVDIDIGETSTPDELFIFIQNKRLMGIDRSFVETYGKLFLFLLSGFAVLLVDGVAGALTFGSQNFASRGVSEPSDETNLRGSKEGFIEVLRPNISLIRRRIKSPSLKFEIIQAGVKSNTDVCLVYLTDKAPKSLIKEIKTKIKDIKLDTILDSGYIRPFLEGSRSQIFSSIGTTERPDTVCAKIEEGRICILVDGTPFALIVPYLFVENFQTMDDYTGIRIYGIYIRWIKYFAFFVTILLPGVYVAVGTFHPELFEHALLLNLAASEEGTPFSLLTEALFVLVIYEVLREAGLRLPRALGGTVSLVSGIIIGDAAVSSGLVSTPLLIAVAFTVSASFIIPILHQSTTILRYIFILAGGFFGLYGISVILAMVIINICSMEDFGIPQTAPVSPLSLKSMRDVITRVSIKELAKSHRVIEDMNGVNLRPLSEIEGDGD